MPDIGLDTAVARRRIDDKMSSMSFLAHLEELRQRIIRSIIFVVGGFGICWFFHERIFGYMQRPIVNALKINGIVDQTLKYHNPVEPFNMYLKISFIAGIFLASPFLLYQIWAFISPGLYRRERKYVLPFMVFTPALFLAGGFFGYRIVYPQALDFLIYFSKQFQPLITISEYTDLFMAIVLGMGLIFEMPILIFFLALVGIVNAGWMWRNFRYAILAIFVVAGIITPTPDVMNMCIFAAPMIVLYLISIGIAYFVHPSHRRKAKAKEQE
jgi:sec-independent protein translocase protein TatC